MPLSSSSSRNAASGADSPSLKPPFTNCLPADGCWKARSSGVPSDIRLTIGQTLGTLIEVLAG